MAKRKRRRRNKHKQRRQKELTLQENTSEPQTVAAPAPRARNSLQTIATYLGIIASFVGVAMTALSLVPKVDISPAASLNPKDPFATPFTVRNDGLLSIKTVKYACGLYELTRVDGLVVQRHKNEDVRSTHPTFVSPEIAPNASSTFLCRFVEPSLIGPLVSGDIAIIVSYRPAFVFWRREKRQRFATLKSTDGALHWHPRPD